MGGLLARGGLTGWHRVAPGVQVYSGWGKGLRGAAGVHGGGGVWGGGSALTYIAGGFLITMHVPPCMCQLKSPPFWG